MASLLESKSREKLRQEILDKLNGNPCYNEADSFLKLLFSKSSTQKQTQQDREQAERWLYWARHEPKLKCVTADIPVGVLPGEQEGQLIDVKVFSRRGPDDEIYDNNNEIRQKVARGNCFLNLSSGPDAGMSCVLQAMKKFTGGLGDDDDRETGDSFVWQKYFTRSLEDAAIVIATRKANGEAAHLSCRLIGGEYVLCGGSKNVHMLFRRKEDIKKYAEPRFRIAREVCETVMDAINKMKPEEKERLLKFLVLSKYTGVFEILAPNHQHVENLSHLTGPELHFITWTRCDLDPSGEDVAAVPPHLGIEIARALGLQTVQYDTVSIPNLDSRMKQIRRGYQYEGEVLYFLDNDGGVMGLLKKKTVWYIMCRAIREKLRAACISNSKNPSNFSIGKVLRKTEGRMREIQKWLALDEETIDFWKTLGCKFLRWTMERFEAGAIKMESIADQFPVVWKSFLQDTKECDDFSHQKNKVATGENLASGQGADNLVEPSTRTVLDSDTQTTGIGADNSPSTSAVLDSDTQTTCIGADNSVEPSTGTASEDRQNTDIGVDNYVEHLTGTMLDSDTHTTGIGADNSVETLTGTASDNDIQTTGIWADNSVEPSTKTVLDSDTHTAGIGEDNSVEPSTGTVLDSDTHTRDISNSKEVGESNEKITNPEVQGASNFIDDERNYRTETYNKYSLLENDETDCLVESIKCTDINKCDTKPS